MKKYFFAYLRLEESELKKIWGENSILTFDANILLNFYRYKSETTTTFFELLDKVKDRTWLTNQAVQEYFNNRLIVISEQEKAYSDLKESLSKNVEDPLNNQRKHPYVGHELLEEFKITATKLKTELDNRSKDYSKRLSKDDILEKIIELFDGRVGKGFEEEKYSEIYKEGDKRYNLDVPPGFKDKNKGGTRQFGDLILWFQLMEMAKGENKDIIFITDDEKEDWLQIHKGRTIGILPALQIEFYKQTNQRVYIFNAQRFIEEIGKIFETTIAASTIDEVKTLREDKNFALEKVERLLDDEISENEIDSGIIKGIQYLANEEGWAELAQLGLYLVRNTPINYRQYGYLSLKQFIKSRNIFEIKHEQISPYAKNVDTAYVRLRQK